MASQHWRNREEILHVQGRSNPRKTVGGVNSCLVSNPILPEKLRGLKLTLCPPGPRDPTETETELQTDSISCGGPGQRWAATGAGALGAADLGMA